MRARRLLLLALVSLSSCTARPLVVAHRGASHDAPENTLAAFRLGIDRRADALETDLRLTKDGRIVLLHDAGTKRTAGGVDHAAAGTDAATLRALDAGRGERIPFLEELLDLAPAGCGLFLEIKCGGEILPVLEALLRQSGRPGQVTIIGFDLDVVAAAKRRLPEVPVCWLRSTAKDPSTKHPLPHREEWIETARAKGLDGLDVHHEGLTADFAAAVRASGLALHAWTVNDPAEARRLASLGVASITTDRPDLILRALTGP
jgi:glycerophosphoryl diester phosphodiesterase